MPTKNIRKPGEVGNSNFCTFIRNCNGLISWGFEIPAYAYSGRCVALKKRKQN